MNPPMSLRPLRIAEGFRHRLKAARLGAGYNTMKEFADVLGVEYERYRSWENGRTEPDITSLVTITIQAGVSADWLLLNRIERTEKPKKAG